MTPLDPDRLALTRSISLSVVEESFPEELDLFDVVWTRFISRIDLQEPDRRAGLPAIGGGSAEFRLPFVVMTVSGVLEHMLGQDPPPGLEDVERAVRAAAKALGLAGARLDAIADAVTPKLHHGFSLMCSTEFPKPVSLSAQDPLVWVEWHPDINEVGAVQMNYKKALKIEQARQSMLVVDECSDELIGSRNRRFRDDFEVNRRAFVGLWFALSKTGRRISYSDLREVILKPYSDAGDDVVQKYVYEAQDLLEELIGKKLIPRARDKAYRVPKDGWSWCWIRESVSRESSRLLARYGNSPRE